MVGLNKLSELDINVLPINAKVKSMLSYTDGIVTEKNVDTGMVHIQWSQGDIVSDTTHHISRLNTVVLMK